MFLGTAECTMLFKSFLLNLYFRLLQYVHGSLEDPKTLTHHKLIHAATERILTESKTVAEENLKDKGNELF